MIQLIALAIIIVGIYFIIRGFTESSETWEHVPHERHEDEERCKGEEEYDELRARKKVKGGGVILIGPIPIVFGESRYAVLALILAIVLMVLAFFFMFGSKM